MNLAKFPEKIIIFLNEVRQELKKVNWPSRQDTIRYTLIVLGVSIVLAIFLGAVDLGFTKIIDKFILQRAI